MTTTAVRTGYAPVNGLQMYYEIRGEGRPLLLLHGSFMPIEGFSAILPGLTVGRQVIAAEMQAHGRTGDIDRPLSVAQMAEDTVALLDHLGIARADVLGYSMGAGIALALGITHPERVDKLVLVSGSYNRSGFHPGALESIQELQPEFLMATPIYEHYRQIAPNPDGFPELVAKIRTMASTMPEWPDDAIRGLQAPVLLVVGDSDGTPLEHMVAMFRLLGGGVFGDVAGLPKSRLAVLPATTHVSAIDRAEWLVPMVNEFLSAPAEQE